MRTHYAVITTKSGHKINVGPFISPERVEEYLTLAKTKPSWDDVGIKDVHTATMIHPVLEPDPVAAFRDGRD